MTAEQSPGLAPLADRYEAVHRRRHREAVLLRAGPSRTAEGEVFRAMEKRVVLRNLASNAVAGVMFLLVSLLAVGLTGTQAFSAPGPTLIIEKVDEDSGFLTVTFTAENLFSPRIAETIARGLPATLSYDIQLWKKRRMWFDKLLWVNRLSYEVRYDPWEDAFLIETREGSSPAIFDLEHIERSLCSHVKGRIGSVELIEPFAVHYIAIKATLRLLSPEDIDRVESWLSEGSEDERRGIAAVPGYLFDLIVGLSGFGDEAVSGRSESFRRASFPDEVSRSDTSGRE